MAQLSVVFFFFNEEQFLWHLTTLPGGGVINYWVTSVAVTEMKGKMGSAASIGLGLWYQIPFSPCFPFLLYPVPVRPF